jgi:flagellar motor switch protein FliM
MEDRGGKFALALPSSLLYPVREVLAQSFVGEDADHDSSWAALLGGQAMAAEVPVEVILDVMSLSLNEVMAWRPGTQLELTTSVTSPVDVRISGVGVWRGTMGRIGPKVAVRLA